MFSLGKSKSSIEVVLGGAVSATECPITASYYVTRQSDGSLVEEVDVDIATQGATAVTVIPAPKPGFSHTIVNIAVYNADNAAVTATVRKNNGATTRIIVKTTLAVADTLQYN